jgi:hypothetical protein
LHARKEKIWVVQNKKEALLRVKNIKDKKNLENNREVSLIYPQCLEVYLQDPEEHHPVADDPLLHAPITQHKTGVPHDVNEVGF